MYNHVRERLLPVHTGPGYLHQEGYMMFRTWVLDIRKFRIYVKNCKSVYLYEGNWYRKEGKGDIFCFGTFN